MASYGRNFHTRISPYSQQRHGRFQLVQGAAIPIGTPVVVPANPVPDATLTGALPAKLATGAQAPRVGLCGLAIYEWISSTGDPVLTTPSDVDTIPDLELFQLITGPNVKVVFTNTVDHAYLGLRNYKGRMMVAGLGASPTVKAGDFLTPGTGTDAAGYWAVNATASNAWLVVTNVDATRQEVEAEMIF
jgi:hypothetical protein